MTDLKTEAGTDDNSCVTVPEPPPPSDPATGGVTVLDDLRRYRRLLLSQERRAEHVRRLLRARLDLTVAQTVGAPEHDDLPLPEDLLSRAVSGAGGTDLVTQLCDLDLALRELGCFSDQLHDEIGSVTDRLVQALHDRHVTG